MVGVASRELAQVQGNPRFPREGREELRTELGVKIAHLFRRDPELRIEARTAGDVQRAEDQRFVHGKKHAAVAPDALQVAQCLPKGAAEADADVLGGVVKVHIRVPDAAKLQVKAAVP